MATKSPNRLPSERVLRGAGAAIRNALGLLLAYQGLRAGKVGVVGPILSTEGGVAALLAVAAGQLLGVPRIATLSLIAAGIALAGISCWRTTTPNVTAEATWAVGAAVAFGISLYETGRAGAVLPLAWALLPPRVLGAAALALPLLATGRLRLTRRVAPLVLTAAAREGRLARAQTAGIATIVAGVSTLSLVG